MKIKNVEAIKKSEALRLKAYKPTPNDVWTIGYGHTKGVTPGMVITEKEAERLLKQDLAWVEAAIKKYVKVPLNQNQYDALGSWVFNLGEGNLKSSTLLKKLNAGDYEGAANEFLKWNKQKNKTTGKMEELRGLTIRRKEERELFLTPVNSTIKSTTEAVGGSLAGAGGAAATLVAQGTSWPVVAVVAALAAIAIFFAIKQLRK